MRVQADTIERIAHEFLPPRGKPAMGWSVVVRSIDAEDGLYVCVARAALDRKGCPIPRRITRAEAYIPGKTIRVLQYTSERAETVRVVAEAVAACVRDITNADLPPFRLRTKPHAKRLVRRAA